MPPGLDALLLDIEGVLVRGNEPLPGALEATVRLRAAGIPFRILTNLTRLPCAEVARRLETLGFSIDAEEIWTPPRLARRRLRAIDPGRVHACLDAAVCKGELAGLAEAPDLASADIVLVGDGGESCCPASELTRAVRRGAALWLMAARADPGILGLDEAGRAADWLAEIAATSPPPLLLGMPALEAFRTAADDLGLPPGAAVVLVSANSSDDLEHARSGGFKAALVASSATRNQTPDPAATPSDWQAASLGELVHRWLRIRG